MTGLKRRFAMASVVLAAFALAGTTGLCAEDDASIDNQKAEAEDGGPWLQFHSTEKDLGKIVASRCVFVFPKDVVVGTTPYFAMKDGYLFVAKDMLYVTDRAGKLVLEHKLPSSRGQIYRGDDWFGYSDSSLGRLRVFHTNGKEIGSAAVPHLCMAVVSRDGSRVFFLRIRDPDARRLAGPIVADVRTGKILSEHHFGFAGLMARGYMERTQAGLVAQRTSSGGLICFDSSGEVAWQSPFRASQRSRPAGQYVLAVHDGPEAQVLKVLDGKGQVVLEKPASTTGCTRILPDGERLLLICRENKQTFRQLYRLKDATRLWSVPLPAGCSDDYQYACLSPDGARLASYIRNSPGNNRAIDKDGRYTFTIAVLDLATGAELLRQELPFREEITPFRQPRWTDDKTIELIPADFLYRICG